MTTPYMNPYMNTERKRKCAAFAPDIENFAKKRPLVFTVGLSLGGFLLSRFIKNAASVKQLDFEVWREEVSAREGQLGVGARDMEPRGVEHGLSGI